MVIQMELDKLKLLGATIDQTTPNIIIEEIARWLLLTIIPTKLIEPIYRAKVILSINQTYASDKDDSRNIILPFNPDVQENYIDKIVNFINPDPDFEWTFEQLVCSLLFCRRAMTIPDFDLQDKFGYPTPQQPYLISPIILYFILKQKLGDRFCVNWDTSFDQMITYYQVADMMSKQLRFDIYNLLIDCDDSTLLKIRSILVSDKICKVSPANCHIEQIINPGELIVPETHEQAIAASLEYYKRDISRSKNPRAEYTANKMKLAPCDDRMREVERINPRAYDIRYVFNPDISSEFYDPNTISSLIVQYDLSISANSSQTTKYEELAMASLTNTFHLGIQHNIDSFITVIEQEDIRHVTDKQIVCHGSLITGFKPYIIEGLTRMFRSNRNFNDPHGGQFSTEAIAKLKNLTKMVTRLRRTRKLTTEQLNVWNDLQQAIELVQSFQTGRQQHCLEFLRLFDNHESPSSIIDAFEKLLLLGVHMRGWNDPTTPWPIKNVPTSDDSITMMNVTVAMNIFEDKINELGLIGQSILALPLMNFQNGEFVFNTNPLSGITIGDKLKIVREQDNPHVDNVYGCIRLTSNYLISTSYRYLTVLEQQMNFNIADLRQIS